MTLQGSVVLSQGSDVRRSDAIVFALQIVVGTSLFRCITRSCLVRA